MSGIGIVIILAFAFFSLGVALDLITPSYSEKQREGEQTEVTKDEHTDNRDSLDKG